MSVTITWYGTASVGIETDLAKILIDPFVPIEGSETKVDVKEYLKYKDILVTHGHLDHILSIPDIVKESGAKVHCTKAPYETLKAKGVSEENLHRIPQDARMEFGDIRVMTYKGKHIEYDKKIIRETVFSKRMIKYRNNLKLLKEENQICQENGETVGYFIATADAKFFVLGSLGLDKDTKYPIGVDMLVLPYQGVSDPSWMATEVITRLKPKSVLLDHFDDTFPPISNHIDTEPIVNVLDGIVPVIKLEPGQDFTFV